MTLTRSKIRPSRAEVEKISVPQADISTAGVIMEVRMRELVEGFQNFLVR